MDELYEDLDLLYLQCDLCESLVYEPSKLFEQKGHKNVMIWECPRKKTTYVKFFSSISVHFEKPLIQQ